MSVIVTVDMYSGRQNPTWELSDQDARDLRNLLEKERVPSSIKGPASAGRLGYRGFQIMSVGEAQPLGVSRVFDGVLAAEVEDGQNFIDENSEVERFLIDTAGISLDNDEKTYIKGEIKKNTSGGPASTLKDIKLLAVPPYNPSKWNSDRRIQRSNNCYNYANDKITNSFAQPGKGSGQEGPYPPSCNGTGVAAQRDGQVSIQNPNISPAQGHIIALVVSTTPGFLDYHFYRRDSNELWSHKPGGTPARNYDDSRLLINDPNNCDRGPYNIFCGYYNCIPSKTRIS